MDTSVAFRLEKLVLTRPQSQSLLSTLSGRGVLISLLIDLEKGPEGSSRASCVFPSCPVSGVALDMHSFGEGRGAPASWLHRLPCSGRSICWFFYFFTHVLTRRSNRR